MQKITKYRLFNKYNLISIIALLIFLFVSWAEASVFIEILTMDYNAPDLSGTKSEIMTLLLSQVFTWERFIDSSNVLHHLYISYICTFTNYSFS